MLNVCGFFWGEIFLNAVGLLLEGDFFERALFTFICSAIQLFFFYLHSLFVCPKSKQKGHHENQPLISLAHERPAPLIALKFAVRTFRGRRRALGMRIFLECGLVAFRGGFS